MEQATQSTAPDLAQADALGQDLFVHSGSTGMVLVVVRGKEVFVRGYGETAPGSGQVPDADSMVRLCSLSKIFASDLLVKLAQEARVRLEDPLQKFAPPHVVVPAKGGHPITLGDLATHTSGLPREVLPAPARMPHFTFPDFTDRWRWLPNQKLRYVPGSQALYSNVGFDLLGDALAHASGEPYARLLEERTTTPLGMRETGFTPDAAQCARLLLGVHKEGLCTSTVATAASSGIYSTARDMIQWLRYLLATGPPGLPVQPGAAEAVYLVPQKLTRVEGLDHAGTPAGIGLGWMHLQPAGDASEIIEKTGGGAGFTTYLALNQPHHVGIFLALTDGAERSIRNPFREANDLLMAVAGLPPLPQEAPRPAAAGRLSTPARKVRALRQHRASR